MNLIDTFWSEFWPWLLRTSWQVAVLVGLVLLAQKAFRKWLSPQWKYNLWLLVLLRLLLPISPGTEWSIFNLFPTVNANQAVESSAVPPANIPPAVVVREIPATRTIPSADGTVAGQTANQTGVELKPDSITLSDLAASSQTHATSHRASTAAIVGRVWFSGALLLSIFLLVSTLRLSGRIVRRRPLTDSSMLDLLEDCKQLLGLHMPIAVMETDRIATPAVFGFVRPRLLFPKGLVQSLSREQLRHVLLHELGHIKRMDILLNWLMSALLVVHWFNPIVWFAFSRMRADRELACDNLALAHTGEDKADYGKTILKLSAAFECPHPYPALAGILEDKNQIKQRIAMIANYQPSTNRSSAIGFALLCLLAAIALTDAIPNRLIASEAPPSTLWVQQSDGTGQKEGFGVTVDAHGNVLVAGGFTDSISLGTHNVSSIGGMDLVLAKYNRGGNCLWAIQAGSTNGPGSGTSGDVAYQVATDSEGNSYFTGYFTGTAFFGSTNITSLGFNDIYLAKYDSNGILQWVRRAGSAHHDSGINLKVDAFGNVYLTGFFRSVADFGNITLTSTNGAPTRSDLFLVKYDSSGNALWGRQAGGSGDDVGYDIAIGAEHVYLTGYFQDTATFDSTNLTSSGNSDIFLAKYTFAGDLVWVTKAGGTQGDVARAIGLDASENIYITGRFGGTAVFGATNITSTLGIDVFLAKYDPNGNLVWVNTAGGGGNDDASGIAVDPSGSGWIVGNFQETAQFEQSSVTSSGAEDGYVARFNESGVFTWATRAGGSASDTIRSISLNGSEGVYVCGSFSGAATFGNVQLQSSGQNDIFIAKLIHVPSLNIIHASGFTTVSWPSHRTNFVLEATENLNSTTWNPIPTGTNTSVIEPISAGEKFYRLKAE